MTDTPHDLIVIGTGVAGLSAAREALRAGLTVACIESQIFGGLILNVNELDGAIQGSGSEFAAGLMEEVQQLGAVQIGGAASALEAGDGSVRVTADSGRHAARAVVVASGAARRKLGVPGEEALDGRGVSHCADCDAPMFRGQAVVIAGGGDSALQSALVLAMHCSQVVIVHRGGAFNAKPHLVAAVQATPNVELRFGSEVSEVLGTGGVEGVRIGAQVVPCSGFMACVGLEPASAFLPAAVERDDRGAVLTLADFQTTMPGVYAAGAVRAGCGGMVEDAVSDGAAAARAVVARLAGLDGL